MEKLKTVQQAFERGRADGQQIHKRFIRPPGERAERMAYTRGWFQGRAEWHAAEYARLESMCVNANACAEAASLLLGAFTWSATSEGQDYWNTVYKRLLDLEMKARNLEEQTHG